MGMTPGHEPGRRGGTALLICACGPNIREHLDLDELARWADGRGDLALVASHELLCSPAGKEEFKRILEGERLESVVIAGCSPKMHEKTFQDLAEEVGYNMAQVHLANIREHCAWVTKDPEEALAKAKSLISACITRSGLARPLERRFMPVRTDVLIIGGGIAGIEAALTASEAGRKVTIVERDISLGGAVIRTEEVAPSMDCSPCLLAPRLDLIKERPNIEIITGAEVTALLGFQGNFTAHVFKRPRYVEESCIGCEACFEVCPVDLQSPFHLGLGTWKAVHILFPGSVPAAAAIDDERCLHFTDGSCRACADLCPFGSVNFEQQAEEIVVEAGAVVMATGASGPPPSSLATLGWDAFDEVYTLEEFERLSSSNGPTGGEIRMRDGERPSSIAVVHCAGSLRDDGIPYCSGLCCTTAVKVGRLARGQVPEISVTNVHRDLVFPTPSATRFFREAKSAGTRFVRCDDLRSLRVDRTDEGRLEVRGSGMTALQTDMVILAHGLAPSADAERLAATFHLDLDRYGFFACDQDLIHATRTSRPGIYLAGTAAGPCDVATAVTRARAAAADALSELVPGKEMELEVLTSFVDEETCAGCKLCLSVCPYRAITFDSSRCISVVNEAICHGCGTCTAACPSGASRARHFTDEEIYAEIGGLSNE